VKKTHGWFFFSFIYAWIKHMNVFFNLLKFEVNTCIFSVYLSRKKTWMVFSIYFTLKTTHDVFSFHFLKFEDNTWVFFPFT
jgi:hypothetical protein